MSVSERDHRVPRRREAKLHEGYELVCLAQRATHDFIGDECDVAVHLTVKFLCIHHAGAGVAGILETTRLEVGFKLFECDDELAADVYGLVTEDFAGYYIAHLFSDVDSEAAIPARGRTHELAHVIVVNAA